MSFNWLFGMNPTYRCKGCSSKIKAEFPWLCNECLYKHYRVSHEIDGHTNLIDDCYECWKRIHPLST